MRETEMPLLLRSLPIEATLIPFPTELTTPPVTKMNLATVTYRSQVSLVGLANPGRRAIDNSEVMGDLEVGRSVEWYGDRAYKAAH